MNKKSIIPIIVILGLILLVPTITPMPSEMNLQGLAYNADGDALDGSYAFTFRIYMKESEGSVLWTENQTLTVSDGLFQTEMGNTTAIDLNFSDNYWLTVEINGDGEMSPRQQLSTVAYSFRANETEHVACGAIYGNYSDVCISTQVSYNETNLTWVSPVEDKDLGDPPTCNDTSDGDRYIIAKGSDWFDSNYDYRKVIVINHKNVHDDYVDFAVVINFTESAFFTNTEDTGYDVFFTDGTDILDCERELYDQDDEIGTYWVKIPDLSSTTNTTIYAYYGYPAATDQCSNPENVWSTDINIMYHMNGTGHDSSSYGNDVFYGVYGTDKADDQMGYARYGDGSGTDYWRMDCSGCYWEIGWYNRTHTVVFNTSDDITTRQTIFSEGGSVNGVLLYLYNGMLYARWWSESQGWGGDYHSVNVEANRQYVTTLSYSCLGSGTSCPAGGNYSMWVNGTEPNVSGSTPKYMNAHSGNGGIFYTGGNTKDFHDTTTSGTYFKGIIHEFLSSTEPWDFAKHRTYSDMFLNGSFMSVSLGAAPSGATGAWAGKEQNITECNGTGWIFFSSEDGWATLVLDENLVYVYDGETDAWVLASSAGSHQNLDDLLGCDPETNICYHLLVDEWKAARREANGTVKGLMPVGYTTKIDEAYGNMITGVGSDYPLFLGLEDGIVVGNITNIWVNASGDNMTGNLNISANITAQYYHGKYSCGNMTGNTTDVCTSAGGSSSNYSLVDTFINDTGDIFTGNINGSANISARFFHGQIDCGNITGNSSDVCSGSGGGGVSDDWVNETGDTMTGDLIIQSANLNVSNITLLGGLFLNNSASFTADEKQLFSNWAENAFYLVEKDAWYCYNEGNAATRWHLAKDGWVLYIDDDCTGTPGWSHKLDYGVSGANLLTNKFDSVTEGDSYYGADMTSFIKSDGETVFSDNVSGHQFLGKFDCGNITGNSSDVCSGGGSADGRMGTEGQYYLYNTSSIIGFNETRLNNTVDSRDSDTDTNETCMNVGCSLTEGNLSVTLYKPPWSCGNITGNTSDLCSIVDTDTNTDTNYTGAGTQDPWVNESGDTMSGNLTIPSPWWLNAYIINASKFYLLGVALSPDTDTNYTGAGTQDLWVNETGDYMTGDLNSTGNINTTENVYANHTYLGNIGQSNDACTYYAQSGSFSESMCWDDSAGRFKLSDDWNIQGNMWTSGYYQASDYIRTGGDLYTTGSNDDIWAGSTSLAGSDMVLYENGTIDIIGNVTQGTTCGTGRIITMTNGRLTCINPSTIVVPESAKWYGNPNIGSPILYPHDVNITSDTFTQHVIVNNKLTADGYFRNLTLYNASLDTDGFRLFVNGTLNIFSGTAINNSGQNGSDGTDGDGFLPGTAGTPGAGSNSTSDNHTYTKTPASAVGGDGAVGSLMGPGVSGDNGNNGEAVTNSIGGTSAPGIAGANGGNGGDNGAGDGGGAGGNGGAAGASGAIESSHGGSFHGGSFVRNLVDLMNGKYTKMSTNNGKFVYYTGRAGSGGSGGGGSGAAERVGDTGGGGGGAGGGGGNAGFLFIAAKHIINNGAINAIGGHGGDGGNGGDGTSVGGGAGGGGGGAGGSGGQGGVIILVYDTYIGSGAINITGGYGGSGGAGGSGDGGGSSGSSGNDGNDGVDGILLEFN